MTSRICDGLPFLSLGSGTQIACRLDSDPAPAGRKGKAGSPAGRRLLRFDIQRLPNACVFAPFLCRMAEKKARPRIGADAG